MTRALWAILFLSLAQSAQAADNTTPQANAPQQQEAPAMNSQQAPATGHKAAQGKTGSSAKRSTGDRAAGNARFKEDLAACAQKSAEEKRHCEREVRAAKAEGLYKD